MKELKLGGARSGKSALAERLAETSGIDMTCVATATATALPLLACRLHKTMATFADAGMVER